MAPELLSPARDAHTAPGGDSRGGGFRLHRRPALRRAQRRRELRRRHRRPVPLRAPLRLQGVRRPKHDTLRLRTSKGRAHGGRALGRRSGRDNRAGPRAARRSRQAGEIPREHPVPHRLAGQGEVSRSGGVRRGRARAGDAAPANRRDRPRRKCSGGVLRPRGALRVVQRAVLPQLQNRRQERQQGRVRPAVQNEIRI